MSQTQICPLSRAILAMLPGAQLVSRKERSWHSATFAGSRITLCLDVPLPTEEGALGQFRKDLPDHDFALKRGLVADIAIMEEQRTGSSIAITIEALLLDD